MIETILDARQKAVSIAQILDNLKAEDVVVLRVNQVCNFCDYFVIATCTSRLQIRSLTERIKRQLRDSGERPIGLAAPTEGGWAVLDYADVVVHLFVSESRAYYSLESLWKDGEAIAWAAA